MLRALDEDPRNCGYSDEQITRGLAALERQSVKQIGSDASHLYHLLMEKNLIQKNEHTTRLAKRHSEITKLRFDKERSNLEDLPLSVRIPLFDLLAGYADGSVMRSGRQWQDIILNDDFLSAAPYAMDRS